MTRGTAAIVAAAAAAAAAAALHQRGSADANPALVRRVRRDAGEHVGATVRGDRGTGGGQGSRLASWVPAPPATTAGRVAAMVWAAPMTLAGLLAGAAAAVVPRWTNGVVLFAPARGVTGAIIRRRGFAATALGHVVIAVVEPSPDLLAHELTHVRQAERLGPFMAPTYLWLLAVHGYRRHPMEIAARLAAGQHQA